MRSIKLLSVLLLATIVLFATSCHSSKKSRNKMSYSWKLYKALKHQMHDAQVVKIGDTVLVIYPELAMFGVGKDEIKMEAQPAFAEFATILKDYNRVHMIINGYTDNVGGPDANLALSKRRAENTRTLMVSNGVKEERIITNGKGETYFVADNKTVDGRQANRRVEFVLYEKK